MTKKFAKIIATGVVLIMCFGLFAGCGNEELKQGVYVTGDGLASVTLSADNEFTFSRGIMYNYVPTGNYSIKKSKLILHVTDNEEYVFTIKNEQLIYVSGDLIRERK